MKLSTQQSATLKRSSRSAGRVAPFTPCSSSQRWVTRAQRKEENAADSSSSRRDFLGFLGMLTGLSMASAAKAADPYEELKALSAARTGSTSLLESFEGTKGSLSSGKVSRGIREKLAAEAAPPAKSSGGLFGSGPKPSSPQVAAAARPQLFGAAPKPAAPKPAPAAAAAAAGSSSSGGGSVASAPLLQAAGVLGLVGVGASVATSAATSKPKAKPTPSAQPSRAATPSLGKAAGATGNVKAGGTGSVKAGGTGKVKAGSAAPSRAATPARSSSPIRPATPTKPATGKVLAGAAAARSATAKVKKGAAAAAAASGSTVKTVVKQALVNEEAPDQPTDFATGGFLGFVGLLAAFLLFGLPKPTVVAPTNPATSDPLVEEAKLAGVGAVKGGSSYSTPLFKSAEEGAAAGAARKAITSAPKLAAEAPKAPPVVVAPLLPPKPAAVEALPAPAPAPAAKVEAPKPAAPVKVEAPKPAAPVKAEAPKAAAPAPAAAVKAPEQKQEESSSGPSAAQNLLVVAGGLAVVVTAFALTGSSSEGGAAATSTPAAAAGGAGEGAAPAAVSAAAESVVAAAESVSAAASAAAPSAPSEGGQQGNAAFDKAVKVLMNDPEGAADLFSVMSEGEATSGNIPALVWSLMGTPTNAERLDGFAFQKLPTQRYQRARQLLLDAGFQLPDSPRVQAGAAATLATVGTVESRDVDPEKLRGVFEALLANEASRGLMRQLLKNAGMPFNEEAFEEQVKDSNYFNLAIAPILRSMPQQKLRVLAELQDPDKLQQLVSSVSTLAQDSKQLQAVTAELSSDVKQTVNTIREAEQQAASGSTATSSR